MGGSFVRYVKLPEGSMTDMTALRSHIKKRAAYTSFASAIKLKNPGRLMADDAIR